MVSLDLFSLPEDVPAGSLPGKIAVAVDVLRASTTIASALHAGAASVRPTVEVQQVMDLAAKSPEALLGGERDGLLIPGFHLSNSPSSYDHETVGGRDILFTTTNGTRAIRACCDADTVLIGSFVNLAAVTEYIRQAGQSVCVVCAGTDGHPTLEDMLFGGALFQQLQSTETSVAGQSQYGKARLNLGANTAARMWDIASRQIQAGKPLSQVLAETQGGKNLIRLGLVQDIEFAAAIDRFSIVPIFDADSETIRSDVDLAGSPR